MGRRRLYKEKSSEPVGRLGEPVWGWQRFGNISHPFCEAVISTGDYLAGLVNPREYWNREYCSQDGSVLITNAEKPKCSPRAVEAGRFNARLAFANGGKFPEHDFDYIADGTRVMTIPANCIPF